MKKRIQKIIELGIVLCLLFTKANIFGAFIKNYSATAPVYRTTKYSFNNTGTQAPSAGNVSAAKSATPARGATAQSSPQLQTQKAAPPKQTVPNSPQEQPTRALNFKKIDPSRINQLQMNIAEKAAIQKTLSLPITRSYQAPQSIGKVSTVNFSNVSKLFENRKQPRPTIHRDEQGRVTQLVHQDNLGSVQINKNPSNRNYIDIKTKNNDGSSRFMIKNDDNIKPDAIPGANTTTKTYFNKLAQQNPRAKFYAEPTRTGETKNKTVVIAGNKSTKIIELNKDGAIVKNREYKKNGSFKDLETPENINIGSKPHTTPNLDPTIVLSEKMDAPLEKYATKLEIDAKKAYPHIPKTVLNDILPSYAREAIDIASTGYTGGTVLGYNKVNPTSVSFINRGENKPRTNLEKATTGIDAIEEAFTKNVNFDKTYQTTYQNKYMSGPAQDYVEALRTKFPNAPDSLITTYTTEFLNTMPKENAFKSFYTRDPNKPQIIPAHTITENPGWNTKIKRELGEDVEYQTPSRLQKLYVGLQGMEAMATKAHIANQAAANPALSSLLLSAPRRLSSDPQAFLQEALKNPTIASLGSSNSPVIQKTIEVVKSYVNSSKGQLDIPTRNAINQLFNEVVRTTARTGEAAIKSGTTAVIDFFNPTAPTEGQPTSMFALNSAAYDDINSFKNTAMSAASAIASNQHVQAATKTAIHNLGNAALEAGANTLTATIKPFTQHDSPVLKASTDSYFTVTPKTREAINKAQTTLKDAALTQTEVAIGIKPAASSTQISENPIATRKRSNSISQIPIEKTPKLQRSRSFSQGDESPTSSRTPLLQSKNNSSSLNTKSTAAAAKSSIRTSSITSLFTRGIQALRNSPEKIRAFVSSSISKISDLLGVTPKNKAAAQQKADIEITNAIKNKNSWFYAKDSATFHNGVNAMITSFYKSIGRDNPAQTKIVEISNQSNPSSPNITFAYHEGRVKTATVEYNGNKFKVNKEAIKEYKEKDGSTEYIITTELFNTPQELTLAQKINNKLFNSTVKKNIINPIRQTDAGRTLEQAQPGALNSIQNLLTASGSQSDGSLVLKVQKDRITTNVTRTTPEGGKIITAKEYSTKNPESATQTNHTVTLEGTTGDIFSPTIKVQYDPNGRPTVTATYAHYQSPEKLFTKTVSPDHIKYDDLTDTYSVTITKPKPTISREQAITDRLGVIGYEAAVNNLGSTSTGAQVKKAAPELFDTTTGYLLSDYATDFAGVTVRMSPSRNTITTLVQQTMNTGKPTTKTLQYQTD